MICSNMCVCISEYRSIVVTAGFGQFRPAAPVKWHVGRCGWDFFFFKRVSVLILISGSYVALPQATENRVSSASLASRGVGEQADRFVQVSPGVVVVQPRPALRSL